MEEPWGHWKVIWNQHTRRDREATSACALLPGWFLSGGWSSGLRWTWAQAQGVQVGQGLDPHSLPGAPSLPLCSERAAAGEGFPPHSLWLWCGAV